ncbi:MAG: hypothetical protein GX885_03685 [Methanomicrobiales archaeon]|nr:hypothetical protein [Methanomicrobiales archaeon]
MGAWFLIICTERSRSAHGGGDVRFFYGAGEPIACTGGHRAGGVQLTP